MRGKESPLQDCYFIALRMWKGNFILAEEKDVLNKWMSFRAPTLGKKSIPWQLAMCNRLPR